MVDALLSLYDEGELRPGAAEIAARAGVSERSVFRHFEDLEALAQAAIERQWERFGHRFAPPEAMGARAARVAALVDQRLAIHDAVGPTARAAQLLAPSSPTIARAFAARRRILREQLDDQFAPELRGLPAGDALDLLAALDAGSNLEPIEYLRVHAGLSRARTRAVMIRTLSALLAQRRRRPRTEMPSR